MNRRLIALPLLFIGGMAWMACKAGEAQGPVEPQTVECPSSGERVCRTSEDCGGGIHCTAGRCYANEGGCPCSEPDDCGSRAHCTRGQCYVNQAGSPCSEGTRAVLANPECGVRAHCTVDTCYANASGSPCSDTAECGSGSTCVSGKCN